MGARIEAEVTALASELRAFGDAGLADRLERCQEARQNHRQAVARGQVVGMPPRCRSVACSACRRGLRRRWQDRTRERFAGTSGAECSMVTVLLSRCARLHEVDDVIRATRTQMRNLRARRGWCLAMDGVVEIDAVHPDDVRRLLSGRRSALAALPEHGTPRRVLWVPCLHAVLHHPGVTRDELQAALADLYPGRHRVDVRPLHQDADAAEDAADVIGYATKCEQVSQVGNAVVPWMPEWSAEFWSWLTSKRRGIEPLRMRMRMQGVLREERGHPACDEREAAPPVAPITSTASIASATPAGRDGDTRRCSAGPAGAGPRNSGSPSVPHLGGERNNHSSCPHTTEPFRPTAARSDGAAWRALPPARAAPARLFGAVRSRHPRQRTGRKHRNEIPFR